MASAQCGRGSAIARILTVTPLERRQPSRAPSARCGKNVGGAIGYSSLALPIAAGVFKPFGFTLRPEIAAISMSGSSVLVAVNALALKRLHPRNR